MVLLEEVGLRLLPLRDEPGDVQVLDLVGIELREPGVGENEPDEGDDEESPALPWFEMLHARRVIPSRALPWRRQARPGSGAEAL